MKRCPNCKTINSLTDFICIGCGVYMRYSYNQYKTALKGRDYKRVVVHTHSIVVLNNGERENLRLKNISARGACVLSSRPFQLNEKVKLILLYPFFQDFVETDAEVIWRRRKDGAFWEIGLDFGKFNILDLSNYAAMSGCF